MGHFRLRQWAAALFVLFAAGWLPGGQIGLSYAGNLEMAEERTEELDELNRQAIDQIPEELPANGQIELKTEVLEEESQTTVEVQEYTIQRGKILRKNQSQGGQSGEGAKSSIPRYDPLKR